MTLPLGQQDFQTRRLLDLPPEQFLREVEDIDPLDLPQQVFDRYVREQSLAASPVPRGVQPFAQPVMRFAARAGDRLSETFVSLAEEMVNVGNFLASLYGGTGQSIGNLIQGKPAGFGEPVEMPGGGNLPGMAAASRELIFGPSEPLVQPDTIRIVPHLERHNILVEANMAEEIAGEAGDIFGFVTALGVVGRNLGAASNIARYFQETALLAGQQVLDTRRFERTTGVHLTPEDYGQQLFQTALIVPVARGVGGFVTDTINRLAGRPIGKLAERVAQDIILGAGFEGVPAALEGEDREEILKRMTAGVIGFTLGGVTATLFPNQTTPRTPQQQREAIELSAEMVDKLRLGEQRPKLNRRELAALQAGHRENMLREWYQSLVTPVIGSGAEIRLRDADAVRALAEQFGVPIDRATAIVREPIDRESLIRSKMNEAAVELAKSRGQAAVLETKLRRGMLDEDPARKRKWESERRRRYTNDMLNELNVTDELVSRMLQDYPELVDMVEGRHRNRTSPEVDLALMEAELARGRAFEGQVAESERGLQEYNLAGEGDLREAAARLERSIRERQITPTPSTVPRGPEIVPVEKPRIEKRGPTLGTGGRRGRRAAPEEIGQIQRGKPARRAGKVPTRKGEKKPLRGPTTEEQARLKLERQRLRAEEAAAGRRVIIPQQRVSPGRELVRQEELRAGERFGREIRQAARPAVWTPVGEPAKTEAAAKGKLTRLQNKNPDATYRLNPQNPRLVERQLRARQVVEPPKRGKLVDVDQAIGKDYLARGAAEEAVGRLERNNPGRRFHVERERDVYVVKKGKPPKVAKAPSRAPTVEKAPEVPPSTAKTVKRPKRITAPTPEPIGEAAIERATKQVMARQESLERKRRERIAKRGPNLDDLEADWLDFTGRNPELTPLEGRAQMGDVEKGTYKGTSRYFQGMRRFFLREWRRYKRSKQGFTEWLRKLPPEALGGEETKQAFIEEVRAGGFEAVAERDAPEVRRIENAHKATLGAVYERPQRDPGARLRTALAALEQMPASELKRTTDPARRAELEKLLKQQGVENVEERIEAESAYLEAQAEIQQTRERNQSLKPRLSDIQKHLPILLAVAGSAGAAASLLSKEGQDEQDRMQKAGIPAVAFLALGLAAFGGKEGRPGRTTPRRLSIDRPRQPVRQVQGTDPLDRWVARMVADEARRPRQEISGTKQEAIKAARSRRPSLSRRHAELTKVNELVREADKSIEEASQDVIGRRQSSMITRKFLRTTGDAMAKLFGEPGKMLNQLAQRMVRGAQMEWRLFMHDVASRSDLRFDAGISDATLPGRLSDRAHMYEEIWKPLMIRLLTKEAVPMKVPRNARIEATIIAQAERLLGLSPQKLAEHWGRKFSAKGYKGAQELGLMMDEYYADAAARAIDSEMTFSPITNTPYGPLLFPDFVWAPDVRFSRLPGYKKKLARSSEWQRLIALDAARRMNVSTGEVHGLLARHAEETQRPWGQWSLNEIITKRHRNLENRRFLDTRVTEIDFARIMDAYFRSAFQRFHFVDTFGEDGRLAERLIRLAAKQGYDGTAMTELFDVMTGQHSRLAKGEKSRLLDELAGFVSFRFLGGAGISQMSAWPRVLEEVRPIDAMRALSRAVQAQIYQSTVVPEWFRRRFGSERWARWIAETGQMGQAELVQAMLEMRGLMPKIAALELKFNLTTALDRFGRNVAGAAGRLYMEHLLTQQSFGIERVRSGRATPGEVKAHEQNTRRLEIIFGADPTMAELATLGERVPRTTGERHQFAWSKETIDLLATSGGEIIGARTQGRTLPIDLPLAAQDPLWRQLYKLQQFNWRMTANSIRQFDPRDPTSNLFKSPDRLRWLAALAGGLGFSAGLFHLKRLMRRADPQEWEDTSLFVKAFDVATFHGVFPVFGDLASTVGARFGSPAETIPGLTFRTIFEMIAAGGKSVSDWSIDPTARLMLRSIPLAYWNFLGIPTGRELAREYFPPKNQKKPGVRPRSAQGVGPSVRPRQ